MGIGISVPPPPDVIPDEPAPVMTATQKELADAQVPIRHRDYCGHLMIPLLDCRRNSTVILPWSCAKERAVWDECEVQDYYRRMRELVRQKRAKQKEEELQAEAL